MNHQAFFDGKTVCVTGGTGSFGRTIVATLIHSNVRKVLIVSRDEEKQLDMRREISDPRLKFVIGDVRDQDRMMESLAGANIIYHAAALKIIPTCEEQPLEAIKTDLIGTINVKRACEENSIDRCLLISCYDKDTRAFTKRGLLHFDKLKKGDIVLTLSPNGIIEEEPVDEVIVQPYAGDLIHFKGKRVDLAVTPNHRMLHVSSHDGTPLCFTPASLIHCDKFGRHRRQLPFGKWTNRDAAGRFRVRMGPLIYVSKFSKQRFYRGKGRGNYNRIPATIPLSDLLYLTGLFVADGFLNDPHSVFLALPSSDPAHHKAKRILKRWGLRVNVVPRTTFLQFSCRALSELFMQCGKGAKNKKIPDWMLQCSMPLLRALFKGLMDGHGHITRTNTFHYTTISEQLAGQVVEIAFKLGYYPSISIQKQSRTPSFVDGHIITQRNRMYVVIVNKTAAFILSHHGKSVPYGGIVWCVRVQNHNLLVERNGRFAFCGNTDKAVKPVNSYGMAKALAERVWLSASSSSSRFSVVRYGNVLGSRGSIVPYFKSLIESGKPLPITHPKMSRFWITLEQALGLVLTATMEMEGGEIFVPKIAACGIMDLAKALAGETYPTMNVGIRPGEKIVEVLISEEEMRRTKETETHFIICPYGQHQTNPRDSYKEYTSETARQMGVTEMRSILKQTGWL